MADLGYCIQNDPLDAPYDRKNTDIFLVIKLPWKYSNDGSEQNEQKRTINDIFTGLKIFFVRPVRFVRC